MYHGTKLLIKTKKIKSRFKQKFGFLRIFLIFKTIFEETKTKPDLENKINSNIDHRQSPVFLFYFRVPPQGLIWGISVFIYNLFD